MPSARSVLLLQLPCLQDKIITLLAIALPDKGAHDHSTVCMRTV